MKLRGNIDMTRSVVALQNAEPGHWHGNAERVGGRKEMKRKIKKKNDE